MSVTFGKIVSLLIAMAYLLAFFIGGGASGPPLFVVFITLLFPLALIWFPEELGSFTGYVGRGGNIDTETPPILISIMGWFFLVGLPVFLFLVDR